MSPATMDAPALLFDLDAPSARSQPARPGPTLDDVMVAAWDTLAAHRSVACPVCAREMAPRYGSGPAPVGGRCRDCDATLGQESPRSGLPFPVQARQPRGERKPLEESPDTTGQSGREPDPGKPAGKCNREQTADGGAPRELRTGKGETVR
jgi:hypothetical protein